MAEAIRMSDRNRRQIVMLRGVLVVAVGALILAGPERPGWPALALLGLFALSQVPLMLARVTPGLMRRPSRLELIVAGADLVLVGLGIQVAGAMGGALPISCMLMALVVALGERARAVAGAAAVAALHAWLVLAPGAGPEVARSFLLQVLFLCAVGLYYGWLAAGIHRARRREMADELEARELATLHDVLNAVSSTLDLRRVFGIIVERISAVVPTKRCSMIYVNERRTRFFVMASHEDPGFQVLELDPRRYPEIRRALETRRPVHVVDVAVDPLMDEVRELLHDVDLKSVLVVPLTVGDEVQGMLCLRAARSDQRFLQRDVDFCSAVARAAANALAVSNRLRRTEKKLLTILDHSSDLILTTDPAGRVQQVNRGGLRLLGYSGEQLRGESCGALFHDARNTDFVRGILRGEVFLNHDCRALRRDGTEMKVELNTALLRNEVHEVTGALWVARDVTELEEAQLQLLQAEKLSSMGEVISGVAHELNNPLSGVIGYSQLLMMSDTHGVYRRELEKINDSALRCQGIVKNLLAFSRAHRPERRYLGLNGILDKTLDIKRYHLHVNDVEIVRDLAPDLPQTMLDYHQIQQVLLNVLNNAEHAMRSDRGRRGRLAVRTWHETGRIVVEIEDNGSGMPPSTLERVFEPFFTTKAPGEGTGLGLSVSYGIVKEHGGEIRVRSRPGRGTTFTIELPILSADGERAGEATAEATRAHESSILVVDDEPVVLDLLIDVLRARGHQIDTASNGEEAARKVADRRYDLVLTDVRMPRMNGIELYREVLAEQPELRGRVLFMTGDLMSEETRIFLAELDAPTISKPIDLPTLIRLVEAALANEPVGAGV